MICIGLCLWLAQAYAMPIVSPLPLYIEQLAKRGVKKVVIDAGHGGHDGGCKGGDMLEKEIALQIALLLGEKIEKSLPDVEVIYTRKTDVFVPLNKRTQIANKAKADLFISIHCNSMPPGNKHIHGTEVYVMGAKSEKHEFAVAKRENSAALLEKDYEEHYQEFNPYSPVGKIIVEQYLEAFDAQSLHFAELVSRKAAALTDLRAKGVKRAGFVVLRQTAMPGVLIETGYLTNHKDDDYLNTIEGMEAMATAIYEAFVEYKIAYEYRNSPSLATYPAPAKMPIIISEQPREKPVTTAANTLMITANAPPTTALPMVEGNDVSFAVQIYTAPQPLSAQHSVKTMPQVSEYKEGNVYKYRVGATDSYAAAAQLCRQLKAQGYKDAFVVAHKDGNRIPITENMKK